VQEKGVAHETWVGELDDGVAGGEGVAEIIDCGGIAGLRDGDEGHARPIEVGAT